MPLMHQPVEVSSVACHIAIVSKSNTHFRIQWLTLSIPMRYVSRMNLDQWLTEASMTDAEFARVSGVKQRALIGKYRRGRQFPSPENLRRIRDATAGAVTADDFVDHHTAISRSAAAEERAA